MATLATITFKNQLTIPKAVVDALNMDEVRRVLISVKDKTLVVKPLASGVDLLAGSLSAYSLAKPVSFDKIRAKTQKEVTKEIAREGL